MAAALIQTDGSLRKELHAQLIALKQYIYWKDKGQHFRRLRNIELMDITSEMLYYNKVDMQRYQQFVWLENSKIEITSGNFETSDKVTSLIHHIVTSNILLVNTNSIFNYNTSKQEDSYILDFIHGNSVIFGSGRKVMLGKESICYFCNKKKDCPEHQLMYCKALGDQSQKDLVTSVNSMAELMTEVLASKNKDLHVKYINRIKDLICHHNTITTITS